MSDGSTEMQIITSAGTTAAKVFISFEDLIKAIIARERMLQDTLEYIDQEDHKFDGVETAVIWKLDSVQAAILREELTEDHIEFNDSYDPLTDRWSFEVAKSVFEREDEIKMAPGEIAIHDLCVRSCCAEYSGLLLKEQNETLKVKSAIESHATEGINHNALDVTIVDINNPEHKYVLAKGFATEYLGMEKLGTYQLATSDRTQNVNEFREQLAMNMSRDESDGAVWRCLTKDNSVEELKKDHETYLQQSTYVNLACNKIRSDIEAHEYANQILYKDQLEEYEKGLREDPPEKEKSISLHIGFEEGTRNWSAEIAVTGEYTQIIRQHLFTDTMDKSLMGEDGKYVGDAEIESRLRKQFDIVRIENVIKEQEANPQDRLEEDRWQNLMNQAEQEADYLASVEENYDAAQEYYNSNNARRSRTGIIEKIKRSKLFTVTKDNPELHLASRDAVARPVAATFHIESQDENRSDDLDARDSEDYAEPFADRERFDDSQDPNINIDFEQKAIDEDRLPEDIDVDIDDEEFDFERRRE